MSFDVNIGRSEPVIKAAANTNNDGGSGGNLGYMMGGGHQRKKEEQENIFAKSKMASDSFELSSKLPKDIEDFSIQDDSLINKLFNKISNYLKK